MRKLAPLFISAAIVTFAGTAAAHDDKTTAATDRTGSPTVSENTIKKPLSYSDKSNTAKGTNAKMKMEGSATAATTDSTAVSENTNTNRSPLSYSDKSNTAKGTNAKMDDSATVAATGSADTTAQAPDGESRKDLAQPLGKEDEDKAAKEKVTKVKTGKKDAVATTSTGADVSTSANGSTLPDAKPSPGSESTPLSATQGEKANSMTGKSAGQ